MNAIESNNLSDGIDAPLWMFWKRRRYVLAVMAFLGFLNLYALRTNLSVAIVAMTENRTVIQENGTVTYEKHFDWSTSIQGHVLSSFFYGYMVTQLPGGYLADCLGANNIFGLGIGGTALLTLITPVAAHAGVEWLIVIRVLEGMFQGITFPCTHGIWARWAPPNERSRLVTFSFTGLFVGTILAMLLSGVLAKALNWESIFYVFGALGCVWYVGWLTIVSRSPEEDHSISTKEKEYILQSLGRVEGEEEKIRHPWKGIFTSTAVHGLVISNFCHNWGFFTLLTQLPTFLKEAMHFEVQSSGFISALPYLGMSIMLIVSGYLADWFQIRGYLTTTQVRRNFNCLGFLVQAIFMITAVLIFEPIASIVCITIVIAIGAFDWTGYAVNPLDLSPKSAGVLMGISNSIGTVAGVASPIVVGYATLNNTQEEWKLVFYVAAAIYLFGAVVYWFWASGELQPWSIEMQEKNRRNIELGNGRSGFDNKVKIEDEI